MGRIITSTAVRNDVLPVGEARPFFERGAHPVVRRWAALCVAVVAVVGSIWLLEGGGASAVGSSAQGGVAYDLTGKPLTSFAGSGEPAQVGKPAPEFTLSDPDGKLWQLSALRGKTILLNFWATWCPPCRAEMPELDAIAQKYQAEDVVVLGVNLREDAAQVKRFGKTLGLSFPLLLDPQGSTFTRYNIVALPTTYFIDREGIVREINVGALSDKGLESKLLKARQ